MHRKAEWEDLAKKQKNTFSEAIPVRNRPFSDSASAVTKAPSLRGSLCILLAVFRLTDNKADQFFKL